MAGAGVAVGVGVGVATGSCGAQAASIPSASTAAIPRTQRCHSAFPIPFPPYFPGVPVPSFRHRSSSHRTTPSRFPGPITCRAAAFRRGWALATA